MPLEKTGNRTECEKGQIVALKEQSRSFTEIGKILSCPKSTLLTFYNRFQKSRDGKNLAMTGRYKIVDTRTHGWLVRESKTAHRLRSSELRNEVAPHTSVKTIKQALASANIKKWRVRQKAFLKHEDAVERLAWAKKYKNWVQEVLEGVISDECMVEKYKSPKGIWVFTTAEEMWHKDCIHGVTKEPGIKLMVWASTWGQTKGPLIPIFDKILNRFVYIGVFKNCLVDVW